MALMVFQRSTSAIRAAYGRRSSAEIAAHLEEAGRARAWLESLEIDPTLRAALVEPIAVVEDAFRGIARTADRAP